MLIPLFRILIIITVLLLIYTLIQYIRNPYRKLKKSVRNGTYFFLDEMNNAKKNILFTYKGCLFEAEKYLGATTNVFEVVDIYVFAHDPMDLKGITTDDLEFLEEKIVEKYPHAHIEWKHPINSIFTFSTK